MLPARLDTIPSRSISQGLANTTAPYQQALLDQDRPACARDEPCERLPPRFQRVRSLKWVAPIHALMVPNGCSAVWRRMRMVLGARSNRSCIASSTASCSQRLTRRSFAGVHFDFTAQKEIKMQFVSTAEPARRIGVSPITARRTCVRHSGFAVRVGGTFRFREVHVRRVEKRESPGAIAVEARPASPTVQLEWPTWLGCPPP